MTVLGIGGHHLKHIPSCQHSEANEDLQNPDPRTFLCVHALKREQGCVSTYPKVLHMQLRLDQLSFEVETLVIFTEAAPGSQEDQEGLWPFPTQELCEEGA